MPKGAPVEMIPASFDYIPPADVEEALQIQADHVGDAKLLWGGLSLLPLLKLRLAQPALLVDLGDVPGLDAISRGEDEIRIGARVTRGRLREHPELRLLLPIVRDAAAGIADPQIRNCGTIVVRRRSEGVLRCLYTTSS